jgi:DNA-binding transcriptional LysR family regulator
VDLDLLRSLVAVANAGTITEAAGRLGITQPALSRRVQQLEGEFGAELLSRSRKGAQLTELGRRVEREARVLIDRYDSLKAEVTSHHNVERGTVRVGGGATAVSFVLPDAIARFQREFPLVHFHVKEAGSSEIASDVVDGRLELGLVTLPVRTAGLEIEPLVDDHIVLIAAPDNPLADEAQIPVADLDGQNFVGFEGNSAIRQIVDASLNREPGVRLATGRARPGAGAGNRGRGSHHNPSSGPGPPQGLFPVPGRNPVRRAPRRGGQPARPRLSLRLNPFAQPAFASIHAFTQASHCRGR